MEVIIKSIVPRHSFDMDPYAPSLSDLMGSIDVEYTIIVNGEKKSGYLNVPVDTKLSSNIDENLKKIIMEKHK